MANEFSLVSTPRYDPALTEVPSRGLAHAGWNFTNASPIYLLDYHRDRLLKAATHWDWKISARLLEGPSGLESLCRQLQEFIGPSQTSPLRLRILISRHGEIKLEKFDIPGTPLEQLFPRGLPCPGSAPSPGDPPKHPGYKLVVDTVSTARSEHTYFKTTDRPMYDAARQRAEISPGELKEVLIVNSDGLVTEGSITTPYFWRERRWVTPPVSRSFSERDGSGGQDGTSRRWALESNIAVEETVAANSLVDGEECWLSNAARGFMFAKVRL